MTFLKSLGAVLTGAIFSFATVTKIDGETVTLSVEMITTDEAKTKESKSEISEIPTYTAKVNKVIFGTEPVCRHFLEVGRLCSVLHYRKKKQVLDGLLFEPEEEKRREELGEEK